MKVVTSETMQQIDREAIQGRGIPGLTLMENAGRGCAAVLMELHGLPGTAVIVAGKGNNGGDGYVVARLLLEQGWNVAVFTLAREEQIEGDARSNLLLLPPHVITFLPEAGMLQQYSSSFTSASVLVDAIFGTGLKSDVTGIFAEAIALMNEAGRPVIAVDIPSGVNGTTGRIMGSAVRADLTVTFALAKLGHMLYPGAERCGVLRIIDIGIPVDILAEAPGFDFCDRDATAALFRPRPRIAHKGSFGHSLIVAGSTGKTGAAAMAANSAVRAGSGLVTLAVPASLNFILELKTTEAMTLPIIDVGLGFFGMDARDAILEATAGKNAVAVGPGVSWNPQTARLVRELIQEIAVPIVVDADGLNAVSEEIGILVRRKSNDVVLTPHPGEMARLCNVSVAAVESDRIGVAQTFAAKHGVHLVLKGARTVIAAPDGRVAINGSGNPGMASGGMGDVLTGMLTALLAQGYEPFTACRIGVFIHGHAADLVAADKGETGMSAVDVQERIPYAFKNMVHQ